MIGINCLLESLFHALAVSQAPKQSALLPALWPNKRAPLCIFIARPSSAGTLSNESDLVAPAQLLILLSILRVI